MTKYLVKANYTQQGLQGLLKDGGSKRREAVEKLAASLGGKLESMYYAFGDTDMYAIFDIPDAVSAATASLVVSAAGGASTSITVLLTPEDVERGSQEIGNVRSPWEVIPDGI